MVLQRKSRVSASRNETVGLLTEDADYETIHLSDDNDFVPLKPWETVWLSRKNLVCNERSYGDMDKKGKNRPTLKSVVRSKSTKDEYHGYSDLNEKEKSHPKNDTTPYKNECHGDLDKKEKSNPNIKTTPQKSVKMVRSNSSQEYRQHCRRIEGSSQSKSCLSVPGFLKSSKDEDDSEATAPPSPLTPSPEKRRVRKHRVPSLYSPKVNDMEIPRDTPRAVLSDIRYSLRTSIGDGSAMQPSVTEERKLRPNSVRLNVSHWSDTGRRPYMEDRYCVENMGVVQVELSSAPTESHNKDGFEVKQSPLVKMPLSFVGVFDGHGGDKASQYCVDWMSSYVKNQEAYPHDLGYAMKDAFTNIDKDFCLTGHPDGTTACAVSLIGGRRIVCANAGDSRAIVIRKDGSVLRISRDHKPGVPDEARRISKLGGKVVYWGKRWRVEGLLAVSRGVGDASLKPYVSADAEVCEYDVGPEDLFLLISSDGVWDVMDNEEAAHVIIASSCMKHEGKTVIDTEKFKWAARNLCNHASSCGSGDNFAVVCVDLQSCQNPNATSGLYETR